MSVKMACLRILNQTNSREDNLICIIFAHCNFYIRESYTTSLEMYLLYPNE